MCGATPCARGAPAGGDPAGHVRRGLGNGVHGAACRAAVRVVANEKKASLLRGLLAGALWSTTWVCG